MHKLVYYKIIILCRNIKNWQHTTLNCLLTSANQVKNKATGKGKPKDRQLKIKKQILSLRKFVLYRCNKNFIYLTEMLEH